MFMPRLLLALLTVLAVSAEEDDGSYYNSFSVCENSSVEVQSLQVLCDSPGTYYYGSNKYRDSSSCQAGDKGKLKLGLYIAQDLEYDGYLTLTVRGYGSVEDTVLHTSESLCDATSISSNSGSYICANGFPAAGYYTLKENFYWGSQSDSYEYTFVPKVIVGFASANSNIYDLGGANTDKCNGNSFKQWGKDHVSKSAANTIKTFFITFGILASSVLALFCAGWCIMRQYNYQPKEVIDFQDETDPNEYHKIAMVGNNRDLVDF